MFDINIIISEYDYKLIIATVYSFDYCPLITVLFHMIFKINISQDFNKVFYRFYEDSIGTF